MILIQFQHDKSGKLVAFTVKNHGDSHVCAAVSFLVQNTINSIEALTDEDFDCEYATEGGYLTYATCGVRGDKAGLLLDAMELGLHAAAEIKRGEIEIKKIEQI